MLGLILLFFRLSPTQNALPSLPIIPNHFRAFLFPKPFLTPHLIVYSWKMLYHFYPKGVGLTIEKYILPLHSYSSFFIWTCELAVSHQDKNIDSSGQTSNIAFGKKLPISAIKGHVDIHPGAGCRGLPIVTEVSVARAIPWDPYAETNALTPSPFPNTEPGQKLYKHFLLNINSLSPLLLWLPKIALFIYLCMYFLSVCHHWTLSTLRYVIFPWSLLLHPCAQNNIGQHS